MGTQIKTCSAADKNMRRTIFNSPLCCEATRAIWTPLGGAPSGNASPMLTEGGVEFQLAR